MEKIDNYLMKEEENNNQIAFLDALVSRKDNALIVDVYRKPTHTDRYLDFWVYLGVNTCEVFLCLVAIVKVRFIMLTSLFSFFYVTGECHRFLHRG